MNENKLDLIKGIQTPESSVTDTQSSFKENINSLHGDAISDDR